MTPAGSGLSLKKRRLIAGLLSASIAINLVDRQVLNFPGPTLREQTHWSAKQFSQNVGGGDRDARLDAISRGAMGNVGGGLISDRLVRAFGSVDKARKIGFTCAFLLSALSAAVPMAGSIPVAPGIVSLALFGNQWVAATYIAAVGDTFPAHMAGRVNGPAGSGGSGATLITILATGVIVDRYSYTPVFIAAGTLPLLAIASVYFVLRRIEPEPSSAGG